MRLGSRFASGSWTMVSSLARALRCSGFWLDLPGAAVQLGVHQLSGVGSTYRSTALPDTKIRRLGSRGGRLAGSPASEGFCAARSPCRSRRTARGMARHGNLATRSSSSRGGAHKCARTSVA
jgi:hypothetical protein